MIRPEQCSTFINDYFSGIGKALADVLPPVDINDNYMSPVNAPAIGVDLMYPMTYLDTIKLVKTIKCNKSSSIKHIKTYVLKDAFMIIPEIIMCLFNLCLSESYFPTEWKAATVVPIPKKKNSLSVNDLRPISLLPLPGKFLEKIICKRLQNHMEEHRLLIPRQHGYRAEHSTVTAINEHLRNMIESIINNKPVISLYLDYKKAFDTVSHLIMIKKLSRFWT